MTEKCDRYFSCDHLQQFLTIMAKDNFNITFYCRDSKKNKLGYASIEMCVICGGRAMIKLPMKTRPEDFKKAKEGKGENQIQEYCREQRRRADQILTDMLRDNVPLSAAAFKERFTRMGISKTYTLSDLFTEYLRLMEKRLDRDLSKDTYNRYVKTTKMFMEYNSLTGDTAAKDITLHHLLQYQVSLNETLDPATSCNYLQKIKSVFKFAFETGKIPTNPAYGLKIDKGVKNTILYLTQDELQRIETHEFGKRLQEIADVFLFSCYTGLSFSDISQLEEGDFQTNNHGYTFVEKTRQKTGVKFTAILLGSAEAILKKYDYRLPVKTSQRTNEYLKEIADICGIDKKLHFHMARHTCASLLINHRPEIPNETIERIMGWTDERQLKHYAHIFNQTVFDDIHKAFGDEGPLKVRKPARKPENGLKWEGNTDFREFIDSVEL